MSDARLTVKVRLQAVPLADSAESVASPAPFSPRRIFMALLMLIAVVVAAVWGWQQRYPADAEHTPAAQRLLAQEGEADSEDATAQEHAAVTANTAPVTAQVSTTPVNTQPPAVTSDVGLTQAKPTLEHTTPPRQAEPTQVAAVASPPTTVIDNASRDSAPAQPLPRGFSRIVLTAQMENLQPGAAVGHLVAYPHIKRLYLFTELKGYEGQVVKHRWFYQGRLHTEAQLTIEDSPWRTYSENWLLDDQRGDWYVEIVDQAQNLLYRYDFRYQ